MKKTIVQAPQITSPQANSSYLKEVYNTNQVENIATNLDYENGLNLLKNSKSIPSNITSKFNNGVDKKSVKCHRCFTRSPSKIGLSLERPSRPSLPPCMKFSPPCQKAEPDPHVNNANQVEKVPNSSPDLSSGQILFV